MVATNEPRPTPAQVNQEEAAADGAVAAGSPSVPAAAAVSPGLQTAGYQPAVVEQSSVTAAPLPALHPVFQVAPAYQDRAAPSAPVPAGTRLAQNVLPPPPPPAPAYAYARPSVIGPGGMQNLASEINEPVTSAAYQPRAASGLHLIAPAEAEPMPAFAGGGQSGGWGIHEIFRSLLCQFPLHAHAGSATRVNSALRPQVKEFVDPFILNARSGVFAVLPG